MEWILRVTAAIVLLCGEIDVSAAEIDAVKHLNELLAELPALAVEETVNVEKRSCRGILMTGISFSGFGDNYDGPVCYTTIRKEVRTGAATPRVTNSKLVEVRNLEFHNSRVTTLPSRPLMVRELYYNCAEGTSISSNISMSLSGTRGYSVTKTDGVSTTTGSSVSMTASYMPMGIGGSGSVNFSFNRQVSTSTSVAESEQEAVTRARSWTVNIPPESMGEIVMLAYESTIRLPFSATLVIDGDLIPNVSGVDTAADLLSEVERTVPFEGALILTEVTDTTFKTSRLPGAPKCDIGEDGLVSVSERLDFPSGAEPVGPFVAGREFFEALQSPVGMMDGGATIGPADGTSYQVMGTYPVMRSAPECGFNDLGIPNMGTYNAEMRQYSTYASGALVARWSETAYVFQGCYSPMIPAALVAPQPSSSFDRVCPAVIDPVCALTPSGERRSFNNQCEAMRIGGTLITLGRCEPAQ